MDEGYLAQDCYRKAGQWHPSPQDLLEQLEACGFHIPGVAQGEASST